MILLRFLLILFLIIYVPVLLVRFFLRFKIRQFNDQFDNNQTSKAQQDGETIYYKKQGSTKKHFSSTDGEYVDYEEVK